jgi:hypothetical protein
MDGSGEHHPKQSRPDSEGQKLYVLPQMQIIDLKQMPVILLDMGHTLRGKYAQEE